MTDVPYQKLDLLMRVTETTNNSLAMALNLDSSYVSRIRNGQRKIPVHHDFLPICAGFIARRVTTEAKKNALAGLLCKGGAWPEDLNSASKCIETWLAQEVSELQTEPAYSKAKAAAPGEVSVEVFYGNEGKRQAVEKFLTKLTESGVPHQLLLYSDEDFSWLYEDQAFAKRWGALLLSLLGSGSKIQIVHTLSRNIGEMLEAIQKWRPLYLTGNIDPWYCPKIRDGIFRKTMFIARGHSAIVSSSVENHTDRMGNYLLSDQECVSALEEEYTRFLSMCRPVMRVCMPGGGYPLRDSIQSLSAGPGDIMLCGSSPSLFTMPPEVAAAIDNMPSSRSAAAPGIRLASLIDKWKSIAMEKLARGEGITEYVRVSDTKGMQTEDNDTGIPVMLCDFIKPGAMHYTREMLELHIAAAKRFETDHPGYHFVLSSALPPDLELMSSTAGEAIVFHSSTPSIAFDIQAENLRTALREYLTRLLREH